MTDSPARIGITIGDPAGVGPEITLKALKDPSLRSCRPVVIGRRAVFNPELLSYFSACAVATTRAELESALATRPDSAVFFDPGFEFPLPEPGRGSEATGAESRSYIDHAVALWKRRLIDAIVTAPVSKSWIEKSGCRFTGHTEYLADAIGERNPFMMMFSPEYRVLLATTHVPLASVPALVTRERLLDTIRTGHRAILAIDARAPRIAIAGLDPHCGDDGAIGDFDMTITRDAVRAAKSEGIDINGPFAADTLFIPSRWRQFSLVIAHYHDQALIPFKMAAFETGVNVTLGLSLVRTSVDHGTAFDIAGRNIAGFQSMVEAIKLAAALSEKNNP